MPVSSAHSFPDSHKTLLLTGELGPKHFQSFLQNYKNVIQTPIGFCLELQGI